MTGDAADEHAGACSPADSAGRPWSGRSFTHHDTAYADDDGSAPPAFIEAVRALRSGAGSLADVIDALREARVLVPLIAKAGDLGETPEGRIVDKTQELSIVTVAGPDAAPILPVFSGVETMRDWNAAARPVPASVQRAAAAALDGPGRIVIDPGAATEVVLARPALLALLTDEPFTPGAEDAAVQRAVFERMFAVPAVQAVVLAGGDPESRLSGPELIVHVVLHPGADAATADAVNDAASRLADLAVLRERLASMAVRMHRTEHGAPAIRIDPRAHYTAVARAEWERSGR